MLATLTPCSAFIESRESFRRPTSFIRERKRDLPEDPFLRIPHLEIELKSENEETRRKEIQQEIASCRMTAEFGVRAAQLEFYEAFTEQDFERMNSVWSTESHISCIHPGMPSLEGHQRVMQSWKVMFDHGPQFRIEASPLAEISFDGALATVSCVEEIEERKGGVLEATNVYKRVDCAWKMILHTATPMSDTS